MSKSSLTSSWSSSLASWSEQQQQQEENSYSNMMSRRPITGTRQNDSQPRNNSSHIHKIVSHNPKTTTTFKAQYFPNHQSVLSTTSQYSRKVFVGGLPPDIDENEIVCQFRRFGHLIVDWPHKNEANTSFPPKGYAFLIFENEPSVHELISFCSLDKEKFYLSISSSSMKDKPVQIRPWLLNDAELYLDASQPVDPHRTVFVGGVPRPLRAVELATIMSRLYGNVCYVAIDTDVELKYPKGAARVSFSTHESYVAAISARFVHLKLGDIDKRAEVKPYVLDDQLCDSCKGFNCAGKSAPFFCSNVSCLQYFCESCWTSHHSAPGKDFHKPLMKEGTDRPRIVPFKWC